VLCDEGGWISLSDQSESFGVSEQVRRPCLGDVGCKGQQGSAKVTRRCQRRLTATCGYFDVHRRGCLIVAISPKEKARLRRRHVRHLGGHQCKLWWETLVA